MKKKKCSTCKILKELKKFHKCKSSADGHQYQCIKCRKDYDGKHNSYVYNREKKNANARLQTKILKIIKRDYPEVYDKVIKRINELKAEATDGQD